MTAAAWLARTAIALLRNRDPERVLALGAAIGRTWVAASAPRVATARINLAIAFPDRTAAERESILCESFENLGRSFAEIALLHGRHREALLEGVRIEGEEHLEHARARSEHAGVLVLTAHFGSWELCAAALAERGFPVTSIHRARRDDQLDAMVCAWRERSGQEVVPLGAAGLGVLRALRRGRAVAMLLDQNARRDEGVFAPFFGMQACTRGGPAAIAETLDVPVVPLFFHREGSSRRHVARFGTGIEIERESGTASAEDAEARLARNVERMSRAVEEAVRADPAQWIWAHRRFRTRPDGEARVYPPRSGALRRLRRLLGSRGRTRRSG